MKKINFGTDGWRGIIADDFVYENIELFGWALISFVKEKYTPSWGCILISGSNDFEKPKL